MNDLISVEKDVVELTAPVKRINDDLITRVTRLEHTIRRTERTARRADRNMQLFAHIMGKWMNSMPWYRPAQDVRRLANAFFDFRLRMKLPVDGDDECYYDLPDRSVCKRDDDGSEDDSSGGERGDQE